MRSVIQFKNSNLTWYIVLRHFQNFSKCQSLSIQSSNVEKFNTCLISESLPNSNKPMEESISTLPNLKLKNKMENILYDRYNYQIDIINGMNINLNAKMDTNVLLNYKNLEITVHSCMKKFRKELQNLFPDRDISSESSPFTLICLNHHTKENMSNWDSEVYKERALIANLFVDSSKQICESLKSCTFWADFIDPFSGTPHYGIHTNDTLFETDPRMRNLGFQIKDLGCCKVLSHSTWKENVFCGIIFTDAPSDHPILSSLIPDK